MKRLTLGHPASENDTGWAIRALREIELASFEDIEATFDEYTVEGTITETRTFNAATASATDLRNVLATIISDIQKRGSKRQLNEA